MAKKTYTLNLNGATSGEGSFSDCFVNFAFDTDATGFQTGVLNTGHDFRPGWVVTGTGPFTIEQPESAGNYLLTVSQGSLDAAPSLTVTQEWTPTVNLSVDDNTISEPSGEAIVSFGIAASHSDTITVPFTLSGTATDGGDYTRSTTSPVTIAVGETAATMTVGVVDDHTFEADETATVTLGSITNGEIGTSSEVTITISSEDTGGSAVIVTAPTGMTLTAKIFARGSDTLIETVTLTERTNCKGVYEGDLTEDESGWYHVSLFHGGSTHIGNYDAYLTTEDVEHYSGNYCPIEDPSGLLAAAVPTATQISNTVAAALHSAHGSGSWTTANISTLATASQLAASSAAVLSAVSAVGTTANSVSSTVTTINSTVNSIGATVAAILDDTGTSGVVVASGSKSGYTLASTGLDAIAITDPGGIANYTTWPTLLVGLFQQIIKNEVVKSASAGTIITKAANGSTNYTMNYTSAGGIDVKGAAT